jgi:hypothetical protein
LEKAVDLSCDRLLMNEWISQKARMSKKFFFNITCVLIFSGNLSETFLILRRIQRDIIINMKTSLCKVPVILVGYWKKLEFFSTDFFNTQTSDFMKISLAGAELFCGEESFWKKLWTCRVTDYWWWWMAYNITSQNTDLFFRIILYISNIRKNSVWSIVDKSVTWNVATAQKFAEWNLCF